MKPEPDVTHFLNVDLELVATRDLALLLEHLRSGTLTLRDSVDAGRRTVWLELDADPRDTDDAIRQYASLVESLPSDVREQWNGCEDRCLNVGIQSGLTPHASAFRISVDALAKLAAIRARLEITIYGAGVKDSDSSQAKAP